MASINISEADFIVLADAAADARIAGDTDAALALDKLARKVNAALSNSTRTCYGIPGMPKPPALTWQDVPSTIAS